MGYETIIPQTKPSITTSQSHRCLRNGGNIRVRCMHQSRICTSLHTKIKNNALYSHISRAVIANVSLQARPGWGGVGSPALGIDLSPGLPSREEELPNKDHPAKTTGESFFSRGRGSFNTSNLASDKPRQTYEHHRLASAESKHWHLKHVPLHFKSCNPKVLLSRRGSSPRAVALQVKQTLLNSSPGCYHLGRIAVSPEEGTVKERHCGHAKF